MIKSGKINISKEAKKFMAEVNSLNKEFIDSGFKSVVEKMDDLKVAASGKNKKINKRI